jgi:acetyl-CoA carboxylase carboxyl transferase subunit beta
MSFNSLFKKKKIGFEQPIKVAKKGEITCKSCQATLNKSELRINLKCCPKCDYYYVMNAQERIATIADKDSFVEHFSSIRSCDMLDFVDEMSYADRLELARKKSDSDEAVICGTCTIDSTKAALAVMDFTFMGGSMGSAVGERIARLIELAMKERLPLIIVSSSGGARMQESTYSLMQMAKISAMLAQFDEARLPYISVLTHPTTGGVIASFAALGDIILAEKGALIGFTGPRVIEKCIGQKLPKGAQRSEYLLEKGMVDQVVLREDIKDRCGHFIKMFAPNKKFEEVKRVCKSKSK